MSTESDAIRRIAQEYMGAANAGDLDKWLGTLTDDIVFLPPDHPLVSGKNAVRAWAKETFFDPFRMKLDVSFDEIEVLGDTAHAYGRFTLRDDFCAARSSKYKAATTYFPAPLPSGSATA